MSRHVSSSLSSCVVVTFVMMAHLAACVDSRPRSEERAAQVVALLKNLERVDVSDEQRAKIDGLAEEYTIEISTARCKLGPAANRIGAARAKAAREGKKGKSLDDAALVGASAREKAYYREFQAWIYAFRAAVAQVLTPQQRLEAGLVLGRDGKWKLIVK